MEEIYWITRLDSISKTALALTVISGITTAIMTLVWLMCKSLATRSNYLTEFNEIWAKIGKRFVIICFPLFLICLIGHAFIPTTKEACVIYGVGGTIDYIRSDEAAKQLPHKVVVAVDKYFESLTSDEDPSSEETQR